jgi:hypothetical protein
MPRLLALSFVVSALLAVLPAHADDCSGAVGLLDDIERIVAGEDNDGWFSDAEAFRSIDEPVLESMCRATPAARNSALAWLREERKRAGDPKALFDAAHELTPEAARSLALDRQVRALERALLRVNECPFWVAPEPNFAGLQSDRERFTLSLETSGNVQLRITEGQASAGGGGIARLLPGYGFDGRTSLLLGAEFGGGAMIRPNTSASQFVINYFPAIPVVLRFHQVTWHYDVETAAVSVFQADNTQLSFGARIGGAIGLTTLRRRNVLPWAGLAVAYEYYFEGGGRAPAHFIRGGLRVGLPWDP